MPKRDYDVPGRLKTRCIDVMRRATMSIAALARTSRVSRATLYRWAKEADIDLAFAREKASINHWEKRK